MPSRSEHATWQARFDFQLLVLDSEVEINGIRIPSICLKILRVCLVGPMWRCHMSVAERWTPTIKGLHLDFSLCPLLQSEGLLF